MLYTCFDTIKEILCLSENGAKYPKPEEKNSKETVLQHFGVRRKDGEFH